MRTPAARWNFDLHVEAQFEVQVVKVNKRLRRVTLKINGGETVTLGEGETVTIQGDIEQGRRDFSKD